MNNTLTFHLSASGCFTAICLASMSLSTDIIILKTAPDWWYFSFLFFATFFYYNFQKISWFGHPRMFNIQSPKYLWPAAYPGLLLLCLIIGFTGTVALISLSLNTLPKTLLAIIAGAFALVYNQRFAGIHFRSMKGFKAFIIALVSVITGVLIPAFKISFAEFDLMNLLLYAFAQLFFIAALCIAADIRDTDEDRHDRIKTFPVSVGEKMSKKLILLLLLIQLALLIILYNRNFISLNQSEVFILIALLSMIFTYQLNLKKDYAYFVFGVDGLIGCQTICLLCLTKLNL